MDNAHLILEAEMGCSHLLSTMETASSTLTIDYSDCPSHQPSDSETNSGSDSGFSDPESL